MGHSTLCAPAPLANVNSRGAGNTLSMPNVMHLTRAAVYEVEKNADFPEGTEPEDRIEVVYVVWSPEGGPCNPNLLRNILKTVTSVVVSDRQITFISRSTRNVESFGKRTQPVDNVRFTAANVIEALGGDVHMDGTPVPEIATAFSVNSCTSVTTIVATLSTTNSTTIVATLTTTVCSAISPAELSTIQATIIDTHYPAFFLTIVAAFFRPIRAAVVATILPTFKSPISTTDEATVSSTNNAAFDNA